MSSSINISASESTIENILSQSRRFTVPDYQRLYSWEEEQWEDFWTDLTNIPEGDTHFLGSIVVIKRTREVGELDELELVDGQQRLTTISILLCAIREFFEDNGDSGGLAEQTDEKYLHAYNMANEEYPNLTLSRFDNNDYQAILDGNPEDAEASRLFEALEFFREELDGRTEDEVTEIRTRLLGSMTIVMIDTENPESAFRLFETLNDRGLELSAVDLMKNSLLQEAMERYSDGHTSEDYIHIRDQWERLLENVVREIDKPNRFFRHFIMAAPDPNIKSGVSNYKLYDEFRGIIKDDLPTESVSLRDYIDNMVEVSDLYVGFTDGDVDVFESRQQQWINQRLANLNAIQSVHSRTLLLRSFREFDSYDEVDQVLRLLEVFMTRWKMAGYPSGSKLDSIFAGLCSTAFGDDDPIEQIRLKLADEAPDDDEFKVGLISREFKRNAQTRYILNTLERRSFGGVDVNRSIIDIEHIAPQGTWDADKYQSWRHVLNLSEEEFKEYRNKLGNLTLLENRHNAAAGNDPFDEKKQYYLSSDFEMTQEVREYDEWRVETIDERTEDLADRCVEVWSFASY